MIKAIVAGLKTFQKTFEESSRTMEELGKVLIIWERESYEESFRTEFFKRGFWREDRMSRRRMVIEDQGG